MELQRDSYHQQQVVGKDCFAGTFETVPGHELELASVVLVIAEPGAVVGRVAADRLVVVELAFAVGKQHRSAAGTFVVVVEQMDQHLQIH